MYIINMIDVLQKAVSRATVLGASYAEARFQESRFISQQLNNGEPAPTASGASSGISVRAIADGAMGFSFTNSLETQDVEAAAERAVKAARAFASISQKVLLSPEPVLTARWEVPERERFEDLGPSRLIELARAADDAAAAQGVTQRSLSIRGTLELRSYVNSEGTIVEGRASRYIAFGVLTYHSGEGSAQRFVEIGGSGGAEVLEDLRMVDRFRDEARTVVKFAREAVPFEPGTHNVVVGPEISGIMAHESVGHPLEADRVMGREGAQGGESYLSPDSYEVKIGSDEMFISDDPTIPGSYGYYAFDEEGVRARKKELVRAGSVNELLHNRETAAAMGARSNAAARAAYYAVEPIVRMSNTFVEPGDRDPQELIREAGNGVYIRSFMEWNIDDRRENQRYVSFEAYEIKGGDTGRPVKGVIIEIRTQDLWPRLAARGRDLEFSAATCGKGDPEQGVPVWTGGPHMLFTGLPLRRR